MSREHEELDFKELLDELRDLCANRRTGTMFIHTDSNHAVRFGLEDGRIFLCSFGKYRGLDAIPHLLGIQSGKYSFAEAVFNSGSEVPQPTTEELLEALAEEVLKRADERGEMPSIEDTVWVGGEAPPAQPLPGQQGAAHEGNEPGGLSMTGEPLYAQVVEELALFLGPVAAALCAAHEARLREATTVAQLRPILADLALHLEGADSEGRFIGNVLRAASGAP